MKSPQTAVSSFHKKIPRRIASTHVLACISLALLATACGKKNEDASASSVAPVMTATTASQAAVASTPAPSAPAAASDDKLQDYIACYNQLDRNAHRSIARYRSWVKDMDAGPSGKEMVVYGLYKIDVADIAKCKTSFAQAVKGTPGKLDAAATAYIDSLAELGALVADADVYYSRDNYKDDAFAKGKKLHAPLAASIKNFEEKSNIFSEEIEVENDKILDAEMQQLEKNEGRQLPYLQMALMSKAKHLIRLIGEEKFDAAAAAKILADYESVTDEAITYVKKNSESAGSGWSSLERATEDYRKAAKERVRRIRDKVAYSEGEKMMLKPGSGWMVEGSQEKVTKAYNELIEASNHMHR
ncbi:YiiG family protein [Undibacterium sp. Ji83W]|uniref:YiiG family protein n=1 Tax=Undibacterium sp. Ji83W TaxID=3413043 RepID=UPI003BF43959